MDILTIYAIVTKQAFSKYYGFFCSLKANQLVVITLSRLLHISTCCHFQVTYMQKLSTDYSQTNGEFSHYKMYKFNGAFLACFQTSHIWGNLASSLLLNNDKVRYINIHPSLFRYLSLSIISSPLQSAYSHHRTVAWVPTSVCLFSTRACLRRT